jgi:hypothetical protein
VLGALLGEQVERDPHEALVEGLGGGRGRHVDIVY